MLFRGNFRNVAVGKISICGNSLKIRTFFTPVVDLKEYFLKKIQVVCQSDLHLVNASLNLFFSHFALITKSNDFFSEYQPPDFYS
jgi:hypothetical protein